MVLFLVPGVDTALVTRQVVVHGRRAAFSTFGGLFTGGVMHASAATAGLSAILLASATAYMTVKIAGAVYLLVLGIQVLRHSLSRARDDTADVEQPASRGQSMPLRRAYLLGLVSNVTNPKAAVFFVAFVPQFVRPDSDAAAQTAVLSAVLIAMGTAWWIGYILLLDRLSRWLHRPAVQRRIERVTGVVFVLLGLRLAAELWMAS